MSRIDGYVEVDGEKLCRMATAIHEHLKKGYEVRVEKFKEKKKALEEAREYAKSKQAQCDFMRVLEKNLIEDYEEVTEKGFFFSKTYKRRVYSVDPKVLHKALIELNPIWEKASIVVNLNRNIDRANKFENHAWFRWDSCLEGYYYRFPWPNDFHSHYEAYFNLSGKVTLNISEYDDLLRKYSEVVMGGDT